MRKQLIGNEVLFHSDRNMLLFYVSLRVKPKEPDAIGFLPNEIVVLVEYVETFVCERMKSEMVKASNARPN